MIPRKVIARSILAGSVLVILACSTLDLMTAPQQNVVRAAAGKPQQRLGPTEEGALWSHLYRERALDALMPLKADRIVAAYRAVHTFIPSKKENYFAVDVGRGYGLHGATVVSPIGQSIGG